MGLYEHWPYVNFHELNLSYILEQLKIVRDEYDEVKQLAIDLEDLKNKYTEVYELYETLEHDFVAFKNDINSDMSDFEEEMEGQFRLLSDNFTNEFRTLENEVRTILNAFDIRLIDMNIELDNAINNLSQSITMINPFTGMEEPLADVIYQLASFHMENAITAGEYDSLNLTAQVYDAMSLTAYQYDVNGKVYLMP